MSRWGKGRVFREKIILIRVQNKFYITRVSFRNLVMRGQNKSKRVVGGGGKFGGIVNGRG